jgi:hypothetical protein
MRRFVLVVRDDLTGFSRVRRVKTSGLVQHLTAGWSGEESADRLLYSTHRMFFRGQTLGKYRILSSIGSGGFGTVYLAEDTWIDKKVALKVPHKQHLPFTEMLKAARLLAAMSHPNIVSVLTAEKEAEHFFIVMEYVQGQTLEQLILREGALDLARALDFTCQICNGVDHAHKAGILHRDLRPGNSPAKVTYEGDLVLNPSADFFAELGGTVAGSGYDQLSVGGLIDLGGELQLQFINWFLPQGGQSFMLIENRGAGAINGTFTGLPEGSLFTSGGVMFHATYAGGNGNDFVVTPVPEPGTLALAGLAAVGWATVRRRR